MPTLVALPILFVVLAVLSVLARDDASLARAIRDGDPHAFKAFFDRYHGMLFHYLRKRGVPAAVAEDLVQHAFVFLWESRERIDPGRSLRAYLFRIGHTRALNHFRNDAKFARDAETDGPGDTTLPDDATQFAQMQAVLHEAIAGLPERRRAVFELCFLKELTYREAADVLGISVKTVEHQMGHALKTIRAAMKPFRVQDTE